MYGIGTGVKPQAAVLKELSTEIVKVYEGYASSPGTTQDNGKIGFVVRGSRIEGIISFPYRERLMNVTISSDRRFTYEMPIRVGSHQPKMRIGHNMWLLKNKQLFTHEMPMRGLAHQPRMII